jgi:hypothetical protein
MCMPSARLPPTPPAPPPPPTPLELNDQIAPLTGGKRKDAPKGTAPIIPKGTNSGLNLQDLMPQRIGGLTL